MVTFFWVEATDSPPQEQKGKKKTDVGLIKDINKAVTTVRILFTDINLLLNQYWLRSLESLHPGVLNQHI